MTFALRVVGVGLVFVTFFLALLWLAYAVGFFLDAVAAARASEYWSGSDAWAVAKLSARAAGALVGACLAFIPGFWAYLALGVAQEIEDTPEETQ